MASRQWSGASPDCETATLAGVLGNLPSRQVNLTKESLRVNVGCSNTHGGKRVILAGPFVRLKRFG